MQPSVRRRKSAALLVAALVVLGAAATVLAGCGGGDDSSTTTTTGTGGGKDVSFALRIGNVLPFTGDLAPYGPGLDQAARIAADQINASLRRLGMADRVSVKIVGSEDSQTQASAAVEAAKKLTGPDKATVIIGDMASNSSIPMAQSVTIPNGVVQIAPTASAPQMYTLKDNGYVWQMLANDNLESAGAVRLAQLAFGKDAAINFGARNDAFGSAYMPLFVKAWKDGGGTLGEAFLWNPTQGSYDTEAQRLVRGNPKGWVIIDFPGTALKLVPALVRTGKWSPKRTLVNEAWKDSAFLKKLGDRATVGLRGYAPTSNGPAGPAFSKLYEAEKKRGTGTSGYEATTFDAVVLSFLAALRGGSADGAAIKDNLQAVSAPPGTKYTYVQLDRAIQAVLAGKEIDYSGAWGTNDMGPGGGPNTSYDEEWLYKGNGRIVTVRKYSFGG